MTVRATVAELVREFRAHGRIVIVGASLAGLRAVEALRVEGFTGSLTIIGDEPYEPYDHHPGLPQNCPSCWAMRMRDGWRAWVRGSRGSRPETL